MRFQHTAARRRLDNNSSPTSRLILCFNTQPPEGGWHLSNLIQIAAVVSTHSRPKAAGFLVLGNGYLQVVSTHSRPKAAGQVAMYEQAHLVVSTHSRPKAAGLRVRG